MDHKRRPVEWATTQKETAWWSYRPSEGNDGWNTRPSAKNAYKPDPHGINGFSQEVE